MATTFRKALTGAFATRLALVGIIVVIGALIVASVAEAAVSISRAELNGTQLRIEGQASPNHTVTVDGVAMGTSDGAGKFRIDRSGFTAPADCTVDVNDGSATAATARLSGCTVSSSPPPAASASLSSLTVSPTDVVGPDAATGTVTLSSAAPSGGFTVDLTSDSTAAATVPPSVTGRVYACDLCRLHQVGDQRTVGGNHRDGGRRLQHGEACDYHGVGLLPFLQRKHRDRTRREWERAHHLAASGDRLHHHCWQRVGRLQRVLPDRHDSKARCPSCCQLEFSGLERTPGL